MAEVTEKITVNLGVVDLGKIDILVEQGFYANRTDFVKDAIRRSLDAHADDVRRALDRAHAAVDDLLHEKFGDDPDSGLNITIGILSLNRADLERWRRKGRRMRMICAGLVAFAADVTPELIDETIDTFKVYGSVRASEAVREALKQKAPGLDRSKPE
ncbi:MAG: CopG family transcriptional regulator [Chloroflexota bacterium]